MKVEIRGHWTFFFKVIQSFWQPMPNMCGKFNTNPLQ
jgi:hypothetical protein